MRLERQFHADSLLNYINKQLVELRMLCSPRVYVSTDGVRVEYSFPEGVKAKINFLEEERKYHINKYYKILFP
jgi:hypothetical protein